MAGGNLATIITSSGDEVDFSAFGAPSDKTLMSANSSTQAGVVVPHGKYNWLIWGTWNGATAQLQFSPDSTTWISFDGFSLTVDGGFNGILFGTGQARVLITGAGGSTSLTSKLLGVP